MKKALIYTLLAAAGLTAAAETVTTWQGGDSISGINANNGTWTIGVNFNVNAFEEMVDKSNQPGWGIFGDHSETGNPLFAYTGTGTSDASLGGVRHEYTNTTVVTLGWGNNWFSLLDTGVNRGLQLGVAANIADAKNLGIEGNSHVYRADMKEQLGDGWTIEEGAGLSEAEPMDAIATLEDICVARLDIVHSYGSNNNITNVGEYDGEFAQETFTTFYLTVTGNLNGAETTIRYMGQFNDVSTLQTEADDFLSGSGPFDVDNVTSITNINTGLIDSMYFADKALTAVERDNYANPNPEPPTPPAPSIPEPATATMSLLALAGLAARRRRQK